MFSSSPAAFSRASIPLSLVLLATAGAGASRQQTILIEAPTELTESCRVRIGAIPRGVDAPVVTIPADDVTVHFLDPIDGTADGRSLDELVGTGILVTGRRVTLKNASVHGFKVGIHAREADGLVLEDCRVERNFAQALGSTPKAEDARDWLWPHANDGREWATRYGAGILIERSRNVTVRRCHARKGQNGLILDRVTHSAIYDNDFSFLSGWGLALWRSSDNLIARNALDFCVRGYSHGVYNRGQDSAGLLMFEQCCRNLVLENSATHSGDGLFGFAGKEALGEHPAPEGFDYRRRGNLDNRILANDFSYNVAHGIEMTFSFGNIIRENRLVENAICGIWGGYSKDTLIQKNSFERNGDMAYGLERGGVNIEHGERNRIQDNHFAENACGVHLWWDADEALRELPWSRANGHGCGQTIIADNAFHGDEVAIHLRDCQEVYGQNRFVDVGEEIRRENSPKPGDGEPLDASLPLVEAGERELERWFEDRGLLGENRPKNQPIGARRHLRGREHILMTRYGPYDWESTYLQFVGATPEGAHEYRLLGALDPPRTTLAGAVDLELLRSDGFPTYRIHAHSETPRATPYRFTVTSGNTSLETSGTLIPTRWHVRSFAWSHDPRENMDGWLADARKAIAYERATLELRFAGEGPSQLEEASDELRDASLPRDRFGTLATTRIVLPPGTWKLTSTSDDGIRVRVDGATRIEDWTWHAPKEHEASFVVQEEREVEIAVEHFELDGYAILSVQLELAE